MKEGLLYAATAAAGGGEGWLDGPGVYILNEEDDDGRR